MPIAAEQRRWLHRLHALHESLSAALQREDWAAVAAVDQAIAACLSDIGAAIDHPQLAQSKRRLQHLHGQALERCRAESERLRRWLLGYLEQAEGRAAYGQVGHWQGVAP